MKRLPDAIFVVDPKKEKDLYSGSSYWEFRLSESVILTVTQNWIT